MKVALIIGHNQRSKGAYSQIVGSEYDYWKRISEKLKTEIPALVDVYERKPNKAYIPEMNKVLEELNKNSYKFCLELHFNSADNSQANGCECLVYYKNNKAKDTYILVEPFFGSGPDEALKFSVEKDVVDLFINFIKENI